MRITGLEVRRYVLPLDPVFNAAWDPVPRDRFEETIVVLSTDEGINGLAGGAAVPDAELLAGLLEGRDVSDTAAIFEICRTVDYHAGRNWTVEVAAHDALARAEGKPLWRVLAGGKSSLLAYASTGERVGIATRVERARAWRGRGIRALKVRFASPDWTEDVALVAALREELGTTMDILVDANHGWRMPGDLSPSWDLPTAKACAAALADLGVHWLEEPLPEHAVGDYAELREESEVPIAAGEMTRDLAWTHRLVAAGAVDVIQNDVVLAGGIEGAERVAGWAAEAGIAWSPHTWTTGLGLLANLHAALAFSTARYLEVPYDPPAWSPERRDFMLPEPLQITPDGTISPPDGPGLGFEPDFAALEEYRVG